MGYNAASMMGHSPDPRCAVHSTHAAAALLEPLRHKDRGHQCPQVHDAGAPLCADLHPHRAPAHIDPVLLLRNAAPAGQEHGDVHGGQCEDEVEEAVVVGDGDEVVHRSLLALRAPVGNLSLRHTVQTSGCLQQSRLLWTGERDK